MGERGTARIGGVAANRVDHWHFSDSDPDDELVDKVNTDPPNVYGFSHKAFLDSVVEVLLKKKAPEVDGYEGRKSLEVILAMYESAKTGKELGIRN
jgi:UDP-N-acetyl-2-amino-2-deoxyglucuronate dehydrogenase